MNEWKKKARLGSSCMTIKKLEANWRKAIGKLGKAEETGRNSDRKGRKKMAGSTKERLARPLN